MIKIELVINIHELLIEKYGGIHGVRDIKTLESAIARPFMTFEQENLYPTPTITSHRTYRKSDQESSIFRWK
jgi:death on curing protein